MPETLYLTVNAFDRFCSMDLVKISGDAYSAEQVINMERKILYNLDFDVS
jgi:hypothetical protein